MHNDASMFTLIYKTNNHLTLINTIEDLTL